MDEHMINEQPYNEGGKYGPGQEMYYCLHKNRLWRWYCMVTNTPYNFNDFSLVYKKKKAILQQICQSLDIATDGTNKYLIAKLDRYEFTTDQLKKIVL